MNKMNTNTQRGYWSQPNGIYVRDMSRPPDWEKILHCMPILDMTRNSDGSPYVDWSSRDVDWSQFTEPEILRILSDGKPLLPLTRKQWRLNNRKK